MTRAFTAKLDQAARHVSRGLLLSRFLLWFNLGSLVPHVLLAWARDFQTICLVACAADALAACLGAFFIIKLKRKRKHLLGLRQAILCVAKSSNPEQLLFWRDQADAHILNL